MGSKDMKKWSSQMFDEIKELENKKYQILARCCRSTLNGAVEIKPLYDKILMMHYIPKLRYCPECGRKLDLADSDDADSDND